MDKIRDYLQWDRVQKKLLEAGLNLFSLHDFVHEFGVARGAAIKFLSRHKKRGDIEQLKRGLYALSLQTPSLYRVASRLYRPSYISFETALSHYGLIPETVYAFTSATPKTSQEFEALGNVFTYHKIKPSAYSGYKPMKMDGHTILIATPEKAVVDFLYFVSLGKKLLNDRLQVEGLDSKELEKHAKAFERPGILDALDRLPAGLEVF